MKNIFYSSKDEIRNRVLKNARDFWDVKNTNDFDPLVRLMIEALSNELFNISNELSSLENRMLDKISRILTSDNLSSAIPAHAILHAKPFESTEILNEKSQFIYTKRIKDQSEGNSDTTIDLYFSPLRPVKIFNAELSYIATGNKIFQIDNLHQKSIIGFAEHGAALERNVLYIGLTMSSSLPTSDGLSFYFDWRDYAVDHNTYDLLSVSKWSINDVPVKVAANKYFLQPKTQQQSPFNNDVMSALTADIHGFYANRFLTLDTHTTGSSMPQHTLQLFPAAFEKLFTDTVQHFNTPLLWIKVVFPAAITQPMLEELSISLNAFPVVNKKMHDYKHRLKMMSDIIPLKLGDDDQFLGVDNLKDSLGNEYTEIPQGYDQERSSGLFSIRYGGSERFDQRNAKEVLDHLFELIRDEKAAFATYGSDFLSSSLQDLEQTISKITQKITGQVTDRRELLNYIVVKPIQNSDIMFLEYWTTKAELGNQIKSLSQLAAFENNRVIPESLILLSSSRGGRSRLNASNRIQAYKYGLTTGNKIVTHADIVNFCFYELGEMIAEVQISKGLINALSPNGGFIKTTDVVITPIPQNKLSAGEWDVILELTRAKLQLRSTMNLHFRLLLSS
jgi:hypothetical protein